MRPDFPAVTPLDFPMISVEEACARVREHVRPLPPRAVPFTEALGLILAEDIVAQEDLPPFPASTVDGYALRAADGLQPRRVVGEQVAGQATRLRVGPGEAAWITTGAALPEGADAVVKVEETRLEDGLVVPEHGPQPGENVRPVGHDIARGERVLARGTRLGPAEIGILATVNALAVSVYPRPRVAVMATGDELVEPGRPLSPGHIRDSNRYTLMAAVRQAGAIPVDLGLVPDDADALRAALDRGLRTADLVISTGGVSMGTRDLLKSLLVERGTIHFGRVRVKPGKPVTFATIGQVPVFALPGNPVSALVSFYLYVEPAIAILRGDVNWRRPRVRVTLTHDIRREPGRVEFQRARVWREGTTLYAATTGNQASSRLLSMVSADVLIRLEADWAEVPAGTELEALVITPAPPWLGSDQGGPCG